MTLLIATWDEGEVPDPKSNHWLTSCILSIENGNTSHRPGDKRYSCRDILSSNDHFEGMQAGSIFLTSFGRLDLDDMHGQAILDSRKAEPFTR